MRILFLSPRQCWPPQTGAKLREFYLARALGRKAEVTHVSFHERGAAPLSASDLPFCRKVLSLPKPKGYSPVKVLRGILGRWPLPVVNYTTPEMARQLGSLVTGAQFDIIHLDSIHMAAYVPRLRRQTKALFVYDWHNIESELMFRYGQNVSSSLRKVYAKLTGKRLERLERMILHDGSNHIVCSRREQIQLAAIAPEARIEVIGNGVDAESFASLTGDATRRDRILFVGSMNYHANVEGAQYFVRAIWPAMHAQFPQWRLTLVGSNPAPGVLALAEAPGVEVTGTVPDVRPYYQEAIASIVPLHTGGGTRLKILEAMAAGVPVVSTSIGAEGLLVNPGADILIADSDEDWTKKLSGLLTSPDLQTKLIQNAKELIRARYDWEILGESLYRTYRDWRGEAA